MVVAAGITAASGLLGAGVSAYGANKAANAQVAAQQAAIAAQKEMFEKSQANLQPFIQGGSSQIGTLQNFINPNAKTGPLSNAMGLNDINNPNSPLSQLLKLTTPGADMTSVLEKTPGFQFMSKYGTKSAQNALAARGLGGPGGALARGISDYNQGLAGTQWQNIVSALQGAIGAGTSNNLAAFGQGAGALQNLVNTGANAAAGLANNATTTGQGIASSQSGIGNAQAAGYNSMANSIGNALGGVGNTIGNQMIMNNAMNKMYPGGSQNNSIYGS